MGEKWSKLPKREKDMFNEAARHDKERYDREMEEFKVFGDQDKNIQDYDAQRPKKCLSSYMIFVRETRPKVAAELKANSKEDGKTLNFTHLDASLKVMKIVGKKWKQLTKKEKEEFDAKAKEDRIRYEKEMAEFNKAIDQVDIQTTDERRGKSAGMKISKHKNKRKHKKSTDNQAEYYYPVKNMGDHEKESSPPKMTYSLRKRNKGVNLSYVEKSEDEFDDEDFKDQKPKTQKVGSNPNQQASKPGRKRTANPEESQARGKRTKIQEEENEDDMNYQMQNPLVDSQRYDFNNMYPIRQPQGPQFRNRQPFFGNDYNMMNPGLEPEYNFNQTIGRSKSDLVPRRQSSNIMPVSSEPRAQAVNPATKRERRSKKYFDQKYVNQPEMDEYINPMNSEFLERRSGSNNRLGLNEDKGTEKSNKDSILFPFQEEEENNSSNKDLPPENELRQINEQLQENEPSLGEEVNKIATRDLSRQDSTRFLNYENQPANDSFGPNTFQFKEGMGPDYPDLKYNQQFNNQMGMGWNNYAQEGEYRNFQMNQMPRMHQNSFGNLFETQNRNNYPFGQDYSSNVMNPNNQFMRNQMNFFNEAPGRRNNSFGGQKR